MLIPSKRTLLVSSGVLSAVIFVWNYVGNYRICDFLLTEGSSGGCPTILTVVGVCLLPIIPLFFFSLITYKMRDVVTQAWMRFALVWIPLSIVLAALTPDSPAGGFGPQISLGKGDTVFVMSLLFVLISLTIITWKYLATRKLSK